MKVRWPTWVPICVHLGIDIVVARAVAVAGDGILTHDKKAISYNDYIFNIGFSNNDLAINVKINDLKHNIARGKAGHHRTLVKKHEDALAALLDYKEGKAHVIKKKS